MAIVTASIAITATGIDRRGRGTVRGLRTGAPDASALDPTIRQTARRPQPGRQHQPLFSVPPFMPGPARRVGTLLSHCTFLLADVVAGCIDMHAGRFGQCRSISVDRGGAIKLGLSESHGMRAAVLHRGLAGFAGHAPSA
ncbi:hypothetical protein [Burkholderia latens]|uniref:hypothetical protein n=1 Tax=Burkholderia latens TaxID=488446 RepID=UPI00147864AA|nr:hypothetical protein [Burkholderia latens]